MDDGWIGMMSWWMEKEGCVKGLNTGFCNLDWVETNAVAGRVMETSSNVESFMVTRECFGG